MEKRIIYKTKSKTQYYLRAGTGVLPLEEVEYNKIETERLCRDGCVNYNKGGGCPPFSPDFDSYLRRFPNHKLTLFWIAVPIVSIPPTICSQKSWKIPAVFSNRMSVTAVDYVYKHIRSLEDTKAMLWTGHCDECKKCIFKLRDGNGLVDGVKPRCRHPELRRFSLESTGIWVNKAMESVGSYIDWWWRDGNGVNPNGKLAPRDTKAICGVIADRSMESDIWEFWRIHKQFTIISSKSVTRRRLYE